MASILIPIKDSPTGEVVEIHLNELPENAADIDFILGEEHATRPLYLQFALEYYARGNIPAFLLLLNSGASNAAHLERHDKTRPHDAIVVNNTLAAYCINQAVVALSADDRSSFLDKATTAVNQSDRIDIQNPSTWITKGMLHLAQGRNDQASYFFKLVLEQQPNNIPALFGIASVNFALKSYADALSYYQKLLRLYPVGSPDPRVGIGLCLHRLGHIEQAKYAFQRALKLNPKNLNAMSFLSSLLFNEGKDSSDPTESKKLMTKGALLLRDAQKLLKTDPVILLSLAEIMFNKGDLDKSLSLARQALNLSTNMYLQAQANYYIARIHFYNENISLAADHLDKSLAVSMDYPPAVYMKAQLLVKKEEYQSAIQKLQTLLDNDPQNYDAIRLIAHVYSKMPEMKEKALEFLKRVVEINPNDVESVVALAEIMEKEDIREAIKLYRQANAVFIEKGKASLHLLNNMAALLHQIGEYTTAEKTYQKALNLARSANAKKSSSKRPNLEITISYNLARLYEEQKTEDSQQKAIEIYKTIHESCPGYADASLRLAYIAKSKGEEAEELFKDVLGEDKNNIEAWISLGNIELERKVFRLAKSNFEKVVKEIDRHDTYCLLALGNDKLTALRSEAKIDRRIALAKEAAKFYEKVLALDSRNIHAANGMAIALLEAGYITEAKEIFSQIRENTSENFAQVNLAHVLVETGQYINAVVLYENVSKKLDGAEKSQIMLYIARAYYVSSRSEKSPSDMKKAINCLQEANKLVPENLSIRFNLALAMQQYCHLTSESADNATSVAELEQALEVIDKAKNIFQELSSMGPNPVGYDLNIAIQREKHCEIVKNWVIRKLTQQLANEELQKEKLNELRRKREEAAASLQQLEEEEKQKRREEEERLTTERQKLYENLKAEQEKIQQLAAETAVKQRKRRERPKDKEPSENSESNSDEEETVEENALPAPKRSKKSALSAEIVESSSDSE